MNEQNEIQVFLSYASQDQERVLLVYEYLVKNGFPNSWIDCKKLLPGQPWEFEIQRNLKKSEIVIFFLSHSSVNKRGFVQKELKTALKYLEEKLSSDTYIIPVKLDSDVVTPEELSKIQFLDLNEHNALSLLRRSLTEQAQKLGLVYIEEPNELDEIHIIKKVFKETWDGLPGYEVEFSIPVFNSTKFDNINETTKIIEASFLKRLHWLRKDKIEQSPDSFSWSQNRFQRTNTFDAHYDNIYHKNTFLSIRYSVSTYGAGAAHPNYHFETFNFLLNPLIEINDITDLFDNLGQCFNAISSDVRHQLTEMQSNLNDDSGDNNDLTSEDYEWIRKGTADWKDFCAFIFSEKGLEISFAPYHVGSYAEGSYHVTVPYSLFHQYLKREFKYALSIEYLYD